jgi:uncharacterized protein YkwD
MLRGPTRILFVLASCIALAGSASAGEQKPAKGPGSRLLDHAAAQKLMLSLINRDRAKAGLSPVLLDEAASKAGLRHARDMARTGFTGHIGTNGSVPEQRYTESGGVHFVQENAACLFDGKARKLNAAPRFDPAKLAALQKMFMDEVPPNDGHRQNVLKTAFQGHSVIAPAQHCRSRLRRWQYSAEACSSCVLLPDVSRPDSASPCSDNAVRIDGILQRFAESPECVVVEGVGIHYKIHAEWG